MQCGHCFLAPARKKQTVASRLRKARLTIRMLECTADAQDAGARGLYNRLCESVRSGIVEDASSRPHSLTHPVSALT